jgi:hypothetical protein
MKSARGVASDLSPGLLLPQNPIDLFFREPACLHVHPQAGDGLYSFLEEIPGFGSYLMRAVVKKGCPTWQ